MLAMLTNGDTVVAMFGDGGQVAGGGDCDGGRGHDGGRHGDKDHHFGRHDAIQSVSARPNPVAPTTELSFTLDREGRVSVAVYDMQGRVVKKLMDDYRSAGPQSVAWSGANDRAGTCLRACTWSGFRRRMDRSPTESRW